MNSLETEIEKAQARDWLPELYYHWAEAALLVGDLSEAENYGQQALNLARELEMRGEEGKSLRVLGETATVRKQFEQAQDYLSLSISLQKEVGDEYEEARSQLALAQTYITQGKLETVQVMLYSCIEVFQRLGAVLDLAAARLLQEELI